MQWFVFGEDWNSHPSSTQHLFKRIVQKDAVVWVNSIGLRSPKFNQRDAARILQKAKSLFDQSPVSTESVNKAIEHKPAILEPSVIAPRVLPFHQSRLVRRFNAFSLTRQLDQANQQPPSSADPRILWLSLPSAVDLIGRCNEQMSVYYCGDDFSALAGVDHHTIDKMEQELVKKCDLIFTASQALKDKFPADKTHLLEHGVDYDLFQTPRPKPANFPEGKVMGFYGQLADWVDIPLLESIAETFSDWTIMVIGDINTHTAGLLHHKNVCYLPAVPHDQLAAYAQHWDIALLPFKHCPQIYHCNPLKLREYLATGTPIVSTDFPAARPYKKHLYLVAEKENFIHALSSAIDKQNTLGQRQETLRKKAQQDSVYAESWQQRVHQVNTLIERHMKAKESDNDVFLANVHS